VASNVLSNDPSGPQFSHEPIKFWPEVAVICLATSLAGRTKGLARVSAANNVNWSVNVRSFQFAHVWKAWHVWPVLGQHSARERLIFAECSRFKSASPFEAKTKPANAGEQIEDAERHSSHHSAADHAATVTAETADHTQRRAGSGL